MELQDDLEVETHIKMQFVAATIILGVVTGVVLIALGAILFAHCIYSACQGRSQWMCQLMLLFTTGNVCPGTCILRRSPDNETDSSRVNTGPVNETVTSEL